jgi:hypothetical protein
MDQKGNLKMPRPMGSWTDYSFSLLRGRGQVGVCAAILISLRWAVRDRLRQYIGLGYALIFGTWFGIFSRDWLESFAISSLFSLCITFFSAIPWRVGFGRKRHSLARGILANGSLACLYGFSLAYLCYFIPFALFNGHQAVAWLQRNLWLPLGGGLMMLLTGFGMAMEEERRRWIHHQKIQSKYYEELAGQARVIAMRNQINPHFFFNTLNTIAALIPTRPAEAERAVELLAQALRPAIQGDSPLLIPFNEELEIARAYTEIETLRFGNRLIFDFAIDPAAHSFLLPTLTLQPLLENAVRYGAARTDRQYRITTQATVEPRGLAIQIVNAPVLMDDDEPVINDLQSVTIKAGHAIENITHRCRAFFGREAVVEVHSDGCLTGRVNMLIPAGPPRMNMIQGGSR